MCLSYPAIRPFVHFLVDFPLFLPFKTLNMNDYMIFKFVKLVQIWSSVVLIWVCLSYSAIRPFVHFLEYFLLLLAIETLNVNDNMIFNCVKLVQILSSFWYGCVTNGLIAGLERHTHIKTTNDIICTNLTHLNIILSFIFKVSKASYKRKCTKKWTNGLIAG